jgi:hypothetical protein
MHDSYAYRIRIKGHLDSTWSQWFDGLTITNLPHGQTELAGPLADQAALHGILATIRDLGITLIAVRRVRHPGATRAAD